MRPGLLTKNQTSFTNIPTFDVKLSTCQHAARDPGRYRLFRRCSTVRSPWLTDTHRGVGGGRQAACRGAGTQAGGHPQGKRATTRARVMPTCGQRCSSKMITFSTRLSIWQPQPGLSVCQHAVTYYTNSNLFSKISNIPTSGQGCANMRPALFWQNPHLFHDFSICQSPGGVMPTCGQGV